MRDFEQDKKTLIEIFEYWKFAPLAIFAKINKVSRPTVYARLNEGALNTIRIGGVRFIAQPWQNELKKRKNGRMEESTKEK